MTTGMAGGPQVSRSGEADEAGVSWPGTALWWGVGVAGERGNNVIAPTIECNTEEVLEHCFHGYKLAFKDHIEVQTAIARASSQPNIRGINIKA